MGRPKLPITPTKSCFCCKRELPRTDEFFYRDKHSRDGLSAYCKECRKQKSDTYRTHNPEKARESARQTRQRYPERIKARRLQYKLDHPEYSRERSARVRREHPEKVREYQRKWQNARNRANPERTRQLSKEWRRNNPDKTREVYKKWAQNHPDQIRAKGIKRAARKRNAEGSFTANDIQLQMRRQKGKCHWCGGKLSKNYHVDHVIPLARGGSNDPSNLVIACPHCNQSKGAKLPHEWEGSGGRLL